MPKKDYPPGQLKKLQDFCKHRTYANWLIAVEDFKGTLDEFNLDLEKENTPSESPGEPWNGA
jgi:hypothetical protein